MIPRNLKSKICIILIIMAFSALSFNMKYFQDAQNINRSKQSIPMIYQNDMTVDDIKYALVTIHYDGDVDSIQLKNGEYERQAQDSNNIFYLYVALEYPVVFIDLNKDGKEDAIVHLVESGGGSGWFHSINIFLNKNGVPVQVANAYLGDRIKLEAMNVSSDTIKVNIITQGPNDGMCCPTMPYTCIYWLNNESLISLRKCE